MSKLLSRSEAYFDLQQSLKIVLKYLIKMKGKQW